MLPGTVAEQRNSVVVEGDKVPVAVEAEERTSLAEVVVHKD